MIISKSVPSYLNDTADSKDVSLVLRDPSRAKKPLPCALNGRNPKSITKSHRDQSITQFAIMDDISQPLTRDCNNGILMGATLATQGKSQFDDSEDTTDNMWKQAECTQDQGPTFESKQVSNNTDSQGLITLCTKKEK